MTIPPADSAAFENEYAHMREIAVDEFTEWAFEVGLPPEQAARLAAALVQLSEEGL